MDINKLMELLRKEKRSPYLQDVGENFYSLLKEYTVEFYKKYPEHSKERRNRENIIADLYNARERKIVISALSFARFGKEPDIDYLAPEEEKTLEEILETLRNQRDLLLNFSSERINSVVNETDETDSDEQDVAEQQEAESDEGKTEESEEEASAEPESDKEPPAIILENEKKVIEKSTIRILEDMPQIVGVDGRTYGSFKVEDMVTLPEANAKIFIKKGAAELIQCRD